MSDPASSARPDAAPYPPAAPPYPPAGGPPGPQNPPGPPSPPSPPSLHSERRVSLLIARGLGYVVYAYVVLAEIILGLGFLLLLLGANPSASFVEWCYRALDRAMQPFEGIFEPLDLGLSGGNEVESVLDVSVLFAMLVYAIVAIATRALLDWLVVRLHSLDAEYAEYQWQVAQQERQRQAGAQQAGPSAGGPAGYPSAPPPVP